MTLKKAMRKSLAPQKGFTLIEMVIVLAIIALLMLIIVPNLNSQREKAGERQQEALGTVVRNQAEMYANDHNVKVTDKSVNYENLKDDKYLTDKQKKQAETTIKLPKDSGNEATGSKG